MRRENQQSGEGPETKQDNSIRGSRRENFRMVVWGGAGVYLLFLTTDMLRDLLAGKVEGQGTKIMILVSSVIFVAAAVVLLIRCLRYAMAQFKASVNNMAAVEDEPEALNEPEEQDTEG